MRLQGPKCNHSWPPRGRQRQPCRGSGSRDAVTDRRDLTCRLATTCSGVGTRGEPWLLTSAPELVGLVIQEDPSHRERGQGRSLGPEQRGHLEGQKLQQPKVRGKPKGRRTKSQVTAQKRAKEGQAPRGVTPAQRMQGQLPAPTRGGLPSPSSALQSRSPAGEAVSTLRMAFPC